MKTLIYSKHIVCEDKVIEGVMVVENGIIKSIQENPTEEQGEVINAGDKIIIPGLIDPHLHGFMGWSASRTQDTNQVLNMAKSLLCEGITAFVPACIATSFMLENVNTIAKAIDVQQEGAKILGIYMEGPFYNPQYNGGTPIEFFENPSVTRAKEFYEASLGHLLSIAIAPELEQADEVIRYFSSRGVRVGIAHSGATYEQTLRATKQGCKMITHTFNAMRPIHHREVGVAGASLLEPSIYNEINGDQIHVCKEMIQILLKMKSIDRILMMTDCDMLSGMRTGSYLIDDHIEILKPDGSICLEDGTIYGSGRSLLKDIQLMVENLNVSLVEAVQMASLNQARFLNLDSIRGSLKVGKTADFAILDSEYHCLSTYIAGEKVYDHKDREIMANPHFDRKRIN